MQFIFLCILSIHIILIFSFVWHTQNSYMLRCWSKCIPVSDMYSRAWQQSLVLVCTHRIGLQRSVKVTQHVYRLLLSILSPTQWAKYKTFPFFCNNQQEEAQERKNGEWKVISAGKSIFTMERGNLSDKRASPNPVYNGWNLKQKKYAGFNSSRSTHR